MMTTMNENPAIRPQKANTIDKWTCELELVYSWTQTDDLFIVIQSGKSEQTKDLLV